MSQKDALTIIWFAGLATVSAVLGTYLPRLGIENQNGPGPAMVLTGVWFGLAVACALALSGPARFWQLLAAFVTIVIGWQVAFNLAFLVAYWSSDNGQHQNEMDMLVGGLVGGPVGALFVWFGAALAAPRIRHFGAAFTVAIVGAVLGMLLWFVVEDHDIIYLLLPWQVGVSCLLGFLIVRPETNRNLQSGDR